VVRADARNKDILKPLLRKVDYILPLAALVGAPLCQKYKKDAVSTNRDAIDLLIKLSSKQQRIIIPTTNSGYGIGEKRAYCTEETPLKPISFYGKTKVEAERIVLDRGNGISRRTL